MPEPTSEFASTLTGRLAEYHELLLLLEEAAGLTVLSCDPFSGASALLRDAAEEARRQCVLVDARGCADALDLAAAIADAGVSANAPEASAWWQGTGPPSGRAGLRLSRTLSVAGVDLDPLRLGSGSGLDRLRDAGDLLAALADGPATLIVDHMGPLLLAAGASGTRQILGEFRALRQRHPGLDLVLAEYAEGAAAAALSDPDHPLFRAGGVLRLRRAAPERFAEDLIITRAATQVPVPLLRACADLAAGVPALTWRTVALADQRPGEAAATAVGAFRALRRLTEPSTARHFETLRRVHPLSQPIVCTVASGLGPHTLAANPKSVGDALRVMRALGVAWQPEPRRWALADPLLAAHARDHAPPWVARRRGEAPLPLEEPDPA